MKEYCLSFLVPHDHSTSNTDGKYFSHLPPSPFHLDYASDGVVVTSVDTSDWNSVSRFITQNDKQ